MHKHTYTHTGTQTHTQKLMLRHRATIGLQSLRNTHTDPHTEGNRQTRRVIHRPRQTDTHNMPQLPSLGTPSCTLTHKEEEADKTAGTLASERGLSSELRVTMAHSHLPPFLRLQ